MGRWSKHRLSVAEWILVGLIVLIVVGAIFGINAAIIYFGWNWIVTRFGLGVPTIGFGDALIIYFLLMVLVGIFPITVSIRKD